MGVGASCASCCSKRKRLGPASLLPPPPPPPPARPLRHASALPPCWCRCTVESTARQTTCRDEFKHERVGAHSEFFDQPRRCSTPRAAQRHALLNATRCSTPALLNATRCSTPRAAQRCTRCSTRCAMPGRFVGIRAVSLV